MTTKLHDLNEYGQSPWLDNISREHLDSGKMKNMIEAGIVGVTSNPSIFNKAISKTSDYDKAIVKLAGEGRPTFEIYDDLTIKDVQDAADMFKDVYTATKGRDGYISLEVSPRIAYSTSATIDEAMRLFEKVNRENLMIKVPATKEGIAAIKDLTAECINVNATLIFSVQQYVGVARAYLEGMKKCSLKGHSADKTASVASVFVSRIDTMTDKLLDELISKKPDRKVVLEGLKGKAAVANSKMIYQEYIKLFGGADWKELEAKGAKPQRVLWASTSTKNPAYSDIKYAAELIGKDTVNTLPDVTYEAFIDHGVVTEAITKDVESAAKVISDLKANGIDINDICEKLLREGVDAFIKDFEQLLSAIEQRKQQLSKK